MYKYYTLFNSEFPFSQAQFSPRAPHVKRDAWVLLREKGITPRIFVSMTLLGATCSPFELLPGAASSTEGCWFLFLRTRRLCTARNYYWSEQDKTEKPSDEPPTDQEHRPGDRAYQAHRVRLIARSIIFYGCLLLGKSVFVFCFFEKFYFKVVVYYLCTLATSVCTALDCVENITCTKRRLFCECTSIIRFSTQISRFLKPSKKLKVTQSSKKPLTLL